MTCINGNTENIISCPALQLSYIEFCTEVDTDYFILVTGVHGLYGRGLLTISEGSPDCKPRKFY